MTTKQKILAYLEKHHEGITNMEAYRELNTTKLTSRINEMIAEGYPIEKVWETHTNQEGETKKYMRYTLLKSDPMC